MARLYLAARRKFLARAASVAVAAALAAGACKPRAGSAPPAQADEPSPANSALDPKVRSALAAVARCMFPHDGAAPDWYDAVVEALSGAAAQAAPVASLLTTGIAELQSKSGREFPALAFDEQTRVLATMESTPFFQTVRATTVFTFYNQPRVWAAFGYEGDAWAKGGYLARGLNDVDWLPEPSARAAKP